MTIAADWVVVEGFLVRDAHQGGIQIAEGANHNVVRRCEATKVGIGVSVRGRFNLITHNFLHDLAMVENTPGGDDDYGAVGVWLFAPDNEVSYNRSVNCRAPSYDYGADGGAVEIYRNGDNSSIHHNWGEANNGFMEVGGGTARNVRLAYNVSVNNGGAFLVIHLGGRFAATLQNFRAENNTIVELSEAHQMIDWVGGTPTPDMLFYRNNLMYTATTVSSSGNFTRDHNLFCLIEGTRLGFLLGTNEQTADPRFVNLEGRDFHVQAGSPAIDAGTELGHASDFDGRTVPQGRAPDVGAYEFSGAAPNDYCP